MKRDGKTLKAAVNASGKSIASLEYLDLNGSRQYMTIRSDNTDNPVIFYIHGGPGIPELPLIKYYNQELEKHFTIVYWEQRGAGISYSKNIPDSAYTISQFIKDGHDLTRLLINRFRKVKIYLMGHSWGTIIATKLAFLHPELYHAYFGIGQMVDLKRGEELSYKFVLQKALGDKNTTAIKELKKINEPPFLTIENNSNWFKQLKSERKWLTYFGGLVYQKRKAQQFLKLFISAREYNLVDMLRIARGNVISIKKLWPEIMKVKLIEDCTHFRIPVYFIQGKHDYNSPTELVEEYFAKLIAPRKELIIFNDSAHTPNFEENERFNKLIIGIVEKYRNKVAQSVTMELKDYW